MSNKRCFTCKSLLADGIFNELVQSNRNNYNSLINSRNNLNKTKDELSKLLSEINIPDNIKDYNNDLIQTKSKIALYEEELQKLNDIDLAKISAKIYTFKQKIDRLNKIREGFKIIPQLLSEYNTLNISFRASEILSHLMDKDVKVNFDTSYNTTVEFDDKVLSYDQLSDGQQIMLGLSIRLAINSLYNDTIALIILDEPGISLDRESLSLLEDKLSGLSFHQIIIISHDDLFKSHADMVINL
ncbi:MAG: hypothetical protein HC945_04010 [Nitrosarchaeum sp.]|nr:hypothetical protein [Nitrosarchaeum sp.]